MGQHVYVRLAGYDLIVIPRAPYRIIRSQDSGEAGSETDHPSSIDVEYFAMDGTLFARLIPEANGMYRWKIDQYTSSVLDVLDVEAGTIQGDWQIQTSVYSCGWPARYAIVSNNFPADPSVFDLRGQEGELIYFQTASQIPDVSAFCAPGQTVIHLDRTQDLDSIVLAYEIDGNSYRQCHFVLKNAERPVVCTAQCREHLADTCFAACRATALSFRWTPENNWLPSGECPPTSDWFRDR